MVSRTGIGSRMPMNAAFVTSGGVTVSRMQSYTMNKRITRVCKDVRTLTENPATAKPMTFTGSISISPEKDIHVPPSP